MLTLIFKYFQKYKNSHATIPGTVVCGSGEFLKARVRYPRNNPTLKRTLLLYVDRSTSVAVIITSSVQI